MNHLTLTIHPDPESTEISKHEPSMSVVDGQLTEIVVFTMGIGGYQHMDVQFSTPAEAFAWLARCEQLLADACAPANDTAELAAELAAS